MPDINGNEATLIAAIIFIAQAVGKIIPDSATGVLGFIRKAAKVVGLYVTNKER